MAQILGAKVGTELGFKLLGVYPADPKRDNRSDVAENRVLYVFG